MSLTTRELTDRLIAKMTVAELADELDLSPTEMVERLTGARPTSKAAKKASTTIHELDQAILKALSEGGEFGAAEFGKLTGAGPQALGHAFRRLEGRGLIAHSETTPRKYRAKVTH
jgi:hypothetical protein